MPNGKSHFNYNVYVSYGSITALHPAKLQVVSSDGAKNRGPNLGSVPRARLSELCNRYGNDRLLGGFLDLRNRDFQDAIGI